MNHRIGSIVFGIVVGLAVAVWSYSWITDRGKQEDREEQERVVVVARSLLISKLELENAEIVDPMAPRRKVGKVYIYPVDDGWEVSGFYRRDENDRWHAYLMTIGADDALHSLKVRDDNRDVKARAAIDSQLEALDL